MQQSVEEGSRDDIIGEDLAPLFERLVGSDDDETFFITFGDGLEEELGAVRRCT